MTRRPPSCVSTRSAGNIAATGERSWPPRSSSSRPLWSSSCSCSGGSSKALRVVRSRAEAPLLPSPLNERIRTMSVPADYLERVYAGVLGKLIGVYLGRPFEGWTYQRILKELGPIEYYVHDRLNAPLVVTDDDISGTFTFLRALAEHGVKADLSAEEIGKTWLNSIVEQLSILWWGGNGNSTEHTAWLNLKRGVAAPRSGSIAVNGQTVSEQIGARIFIDGWALVAPGKPRLAARLAEAAASVSHDGESVNAAKLLAAMEAEAFLSADI